MKLNKKLIEFTDPEKEALKTTSEILEEIANSSVCDRLWQTFSPSVQYDGDDFSVSDFLDIKRLINAVLEL